MSTPAPDGTRATREAAHVRLERRTPAPGRAAPPPPAALPARLARWLDANGPLGLALAMLLAIGYAWWLYSYPMLRGTAPFWWRDSADITQYLAGFNAYVHEPWRWPLLRLESLNTPDGTLATFLDTIPLYAMFLKLVHPGAGYWNPYGLWIALCFTLQGVGAWWLCREARVRNWAALAALALLLASFPALTFRISHTSLMSQWMLVFALAIYLRGSRLGRLALGPWTALLVGGFYINIYLFVMASAIFAADVLRDLLRAPVTRATAARALAAPLLVYGLLFATMWITMLPLPPGSGQREWGFGYFSMNLLAPLHGGRLLQFAHPVAHDGQGEGFNYLGIFVLGLALLSYKLHAWRDPGFWRRHGVLAAVLALLAMYSLSNIVWLGDNRLYSLELPPLFDGVTSALRSSGRFFWPVGYAAVIFAVLGAARHLGGLRAAAVLALVVALQLWDLKPQHAWVRATAGQHSEPVIDPARWQAFLGPDIKALHYYPPFRCGATSSPSLLPSMAYAVQHGYPLSTGYIARATKSCVNYGAEIARLPAHTAVIFDKQTYPQQADAERLMAPGAACADMQIVFLCRRGATPSDGNTP